ncbi:MAG: elongation factor P [Alphaproteobacteria bacterium]|jgi:elongation factor P|nr:elongation factor P [Alphaproteobacteria bacterium]MDP6255934.1 elongation factor P [Alphaproteobacteria bacterium]MDP7055101.1 elongation factor P [Alphaproteobacteria bacterium]MDP7227211.1 elongation factor P [Alphaproteobacteria bacterium]MDP7462117.1 elongation factor P [Alphaproteobacteria bacterium]|tara:strand:+ start:2357 stop:2920 length:564 start_codon:yes stop_codon:yes gene_type:complete
MRINGNAIRPGNVVEHKGGLWRAVKIAHTQPGKGGAYLQVELRNLLDGSKLNERFRASENVEKVRLDQKDHQFLFGDGDSFTFMDTKTYDQIALNADQLGEQAAYLQDGMTVSIESHEGAVIGVALPEHVTLEVMDTEPVLKGQTAAASYKPAVLENDIRSSVPPFVGVGDKVVVNTEDGSYVKRAE